MAKYKITAPDGHTYQIEGPDGADDATIAAAVLAQYPDSDKPPSAPPPPVDALTDNYGERLKNGADRMNAANAGEPMPPLLAPSRQQPVGQEPPPKTYDNNFEMAADTFASGVGQASMGFDELIYPSKYNQPRIFGRVANEPDGYFPHFARGVSNIAQGGLGAIIGGALTGAAGKQILEPSASALSKMYTDAGGSKEGPLSDAAKWSDTDEDVLGGVTLGLGGAATRLAVKALKKSAWYYRDLQARVKDNYSKADVVYDPSVGTSLGNEIDRLLAEHNPSVAKDGPIRKALQDLQSDINSGARPLTQDAFAEYRSRLEKVKGDPVINQKMASVILEDVDEFLKEKILWNETAPVISGDMKRSAIARRNADTGYAQLQAFKTSRQQRIDRKIDEGGVKEGGEGPENIANLKDQLGRRDRQRLGLKGEDAETPVPRGITNQLARAVMGTRTGNFASAVGTVSSHLPTTALSALALSTAAYNYPEYAVPLGGIAVAALSARKIGKISRKRQQDIYDLRQTKPKDKPVPPPAGGPPIPPPPPGAAPPAPPPPGALPTPPAAAKAAKMPIPSQQQLLAMRKSMTPTQFRDFLGALRAAYPKLHMTRAYPEAPAGYPYHKGEE